MEGWRLSVCRGGVSGVLGLDENSLGRHDVWRLGDVGGMYRRFDGTVCLCLWRLSWAEVLCCFSDFRG